MVELIFWAVWAIGIMFALGFCHKNDDRETWLEFIHYIGFIFLAWPMAIGGECCNPTGPATYREQISC